MTILRTAYRKATPASLRKGVWKARRRVPRRLHDLQWEVGPEARLSRWTDGQLDLGPWYWLFLLGCNNSGTTLLVETLQSHPLIRKLPKEGQRLTKAIPNSAPLGIGRVFTQRLDLFRQTESGDGMCVPRLRYDWAYFSDPRPGIRLEKSPPNTLRSRWLQRHFAPARFLVLVRDPYAVCEGIARRRGHSIEEAAVHWRTVHEILQEDLPHLERALTVRYEDFCERPLDVLETVRGFLGLEEPFDASLATREFNAHNMSGAPHQLENFNDRSIRRLSTGDRETITRVIGDRMTPWGYQPPGGTAS
ncbi:MAG TPA: sulfotransferase [Vicinamibacterales bacterium]|nr:sulfotransferase [Vicinamibacterales bacterium]